MISLQKVSKTYPSRDDAVDALQNVTLTIPQGELTVIVGPSGSGKSTLLHLIAGLDQPTAGEIMVNGEDLNKLSDKKISHYRAETVGLVFQDFKLQPYLDLRENLQVPLLFRAKKLSGRGGKKRADDMLKAFDLENRVSHKPSEISGGQKQRVAIARALMNAPKILLADEPTGNLDSVTGEKIIKLLVKIQKEKKITMVIVTHDSSIAQYASNIIQMKDGKVVPRKTGFKKFLK